MAESMIIPMDVINNTIRNAKTCIACEDTDYQKQYYRGIADAFEKLKQLAKENKLKLKG